MRAFSASCARVHTQAVGKESTVPSLEKRGHLVVEKTASNRCKSTVPHLRCYTDLKGRATIVPLLLASRIACLLCCQCFCEVLSARGAHQQAFTHIKTIHCSFSVPSAAVHTSCHLHSLLHLCFPRASGCFGGHVIQILRHAPPLRFALSIPFFRAAFSVQLRCQSKQHADNLFQKTHTPHTRPPAKATHHHQQQYVRSSEGAVGSGVKPGMVDRLSSRLLLVFVVDTTLFLNNSSLCCSSSPIFDKNDH